MTKSVSHLANERRSESVLRSFFGEAHRCVLGQVLAPSMSCIVDIGAGTGSVTSFLRRCCPNAQVYAVDMWHAGYAADLYDISSQTEAAAEMRRLEGFSPEAFYNSFCKRYGPPIGRGRQANICTS